MSAILRGRVLFLVCSKCGREKGIAVGASAQTLPQHKEVESAVKIGWVVSDENDSTCAQCLGKVLRDTKKALGKNTSK